MDPPARRRLLAWYRRVRRDLPWRRSRDPYAVLVSEVMLQQTRVDVAIPYYERWMLRFPTAATLADASEEEVLRAWSGLGYYRRARNLQAAARRIREQGFPRTAEGLRELPGVGPYTAGAVASIAFGQRVAAVDTNADRVAARVLGSASAAHRREALQSWVPRKSGEWNQAVMELGALVCKARAPRCGECPLAAVCAGGRVEARRRPARRVEERHYALIVRDGNVLAVRTDRGLLAGMYSLPGGGTIDDLSRDVRAQTGLGMRRRGAAGNATHAFSHRRWDMTVHRAQPTSTAALPSARWVPLADLDSVPWSAAMRRALASVGIPEAP